MRPSRELVNFLLANFYARNGSVALATGDQREVTNFVEFAPFDTVTQNQSNKDDRFLL